MSDVENWTVFVPVVLPVRVIVMTAVCDSSSIYEDELNCTVVAGVPVGVAVGVDVGVGDGVADAVGVGVGVFVGVAVAVAVGVAVAVPVGVGVAPVHGMPVIVSTLTPNPATLLSEAILHFSLMLWLLAAAGRLTVVVM